MFTVSAFFFSKFYFFFNFSFLFLKFSFFSEFFFKFSFLQNFRIFFFKRSFFFHFHFFSKFLFFSCLKFAISTKNCIFNIWNRNFHFFFCFEKQIHFFEFFQSHFTTIVKKFYTIFLLKINKKISKTQNIAKNFRFLSRQGCKYVFGKKNGVSKIEFNIYSFLRFPLGSYTNYIKKWGVIKKCNFYKKRLYLTI